MPSSSAHIPALPAGGELAPSFEALLSLGLYAAIALFLVGVLLLLAWALGHKTRHPVKQQPYESGIAPTGSARLGEPVPFYLVAIFFIVFDVEIIFVVSWAVAYDLLGWAGFFQITFFIAMLFVGLLYLWKAGGLDWGPSAMRRKGRKP
ncbi:NADH-quinone oxidoreductase subunit A [Desulfuromonas sp. AOP6]|uniref:NADH-quinone oxidoreductase subunit A n=1 Tax=Desulfuromonas sp. AOP6 TaxID=1566351 RepID=UPI0012845F3E|nr:NADH-quinone oxidoreductase subunit A [Desulfuromonas sp. AOP6]BCA80910.1 NADH-quinone oxidoreductase subunit A 2 [Desulfuromonas sp. AOP6]